MKVLGLVASGRRMGNCEVLAKYVLNECRDTGADVSLLRLSDWSIKECMGCFGCLFKNKECDINDDMKKLARYILHEHDRVLVIAPTYLLSTPGIMKVIIDRIGIFVHLGMNSDVRIKHGAVIGIAGVSGWDYFTMPMLTMFTKIITAYQANIVDRALFHHPGPGEVIMSTKTLERAKVLSKNLLEGTRRENKQSTASGLQCPVCSSTSFIIHKSDTLSVECPFCRVRGNRAPDGLFTWDDYTLEHNRFTEEAGREFVDSWIMKTREVFEKNYKTILLQKQRYKDSNINMKWAKP